MSANYAERSTRGLRAVHDAGASAHRPGVWALRQPGLHRIGHVSTFVFRLKAPRPTFALDMTDEEREIMARHAAYWQPTVDSGRMVIFGPVLDGSGSWGLGVVEADDEEENARARKWRSGGQFRHRRN